MVYSTELAFAKALARDSGKMMRGAFGLKTAKIWKDDHSPVTEADIAINKFVIEKVKKAFPDDGVLGEDASYKKSRKRLWVVDPIDGTYPFTLGAPLFTFCLALVDESVPVLGIVYDPMTDRMFWAQKGGGAFVNNDRINVSKARTLKDHYALLSSRTSGSSTPTGIIFDRIEQHGGKAFNFRSFAYSSMFVAAGSAVAATIGTPKPWDVAAAQVIIEEAGGKITDLSGNTRKYDSNSGLIASNGPVHDEMIEIVNE